MGFWKNLYRNFTVPGMLGVGLNKSPYIQDQDLWNRLGSGAAPGNYEGIDPETGAYRVLPDGRIAAQAQHNVNRFMWRRRDRLYADATNTIENALGNLESWRPGGAAAMTSGLYQGKAQTQMARAQATTPLDQLYWDRRDAEMRARKAAEKSAYIGAAGNILGMAAGAALGGGRGVLAAGAQGLGQGIGQGIGRGIGGAASQAGMPSGGAVAAGSGAATGAISALGGAGAPQAQGPQVQGPQPRAYANAPEGGVGPIQQPPPGPQRQGGGGPQFPQSQAGGPTGGAPGPAGSPGGGSVGAGGPAMGSGAGGAGGTGRPETQQAMPGASFNPTAFAEQRSAQYGGALDEAFSEAMAQLQDDGFWETRIDAANRMSMEIEDEDWELSAA